MRGLYATPDPSTCTQDLYASRLWALRTLLAEPEPTVPAFMRTAAWRKKQLQTALGSWTELKHDTIVYTKQPYGVAQAAMAGKGGWARYLPAEVVHGYVEPVPQLYAALGQSVAQLREKYVALGFPKDSALMANFQQLEALLASLEGIAKKELSGEAPTEQEYRLIENIDRSLAMLLRYAHYTDVHKEFASEMDNEMAVVADVFTQVNEERVLEEAIGPPAEIFVIAPVDGKDKVCRGVAYAYYEFKQPFSDRLTDEKWRQILEQSKQPSQPTWTQEISVAPK